MNQTNKCKEDCVCKIEGKTHSFNDGCGCPMHNGEEFDTSPKEETYCRYGAKNCFDHPPKEEIVNDWEIFLICRWQQLRDFYGRELSPKDLKNSIEYIISSTEKRVANEIIGEIKRYSYETKIDGRFMKLTEIINLIKSKYE